MSDSLAPDDLEGQDTGLGSEQNSRASQGPKRARQADGHRRSPGDPATDPARDYVVISISTYPADLARWDAEVERRKAAGERKACRSSVIREAMAAMIGRGR